MLQSLLVNLLENRVYLGRLAIISTIIPFYLSTIPKLLYPMMLAGIVLLLTLNSSILIGWINKFIRAHYWLKIQYFWFVVSMGVVSMLVFANIEFFVDFSYVVGLIFLIINVIWFNKINSKMTAENRRIILKGYTTETKRTLDFEPYLIPLLLTVMVTFFIASIQSLFITKGIKILTIEVIHWSFPIVVILIYFIIDLLFMEQIDWEVSDGHTRWKEFEFSRPIPSVKHPQQLALYFAEASRLTQPPDEAVDLITENLAYLVEHAQDLRYFPFQLNYVRALENWGREGRDHVHLMLAIVLASISQYRFIGLIPIYKRKMFYQCLGVVAMTGSMTPQWRELIQYEVLEKKDEHYVLDWVLGSRYLEIKYNPDWLISWEGNIYKGKVGYYEAVRKMEYLIHLRPQMPDWAEDIWNLSLEYVKVFIGEEARTIMSANIKFYDQLLYLASGRTKEEYVEDKHKYRQSLLNPTNRLVYSEPVKSLKEYTPEQRTEIISAYLSSDTMQSESSSLMDNISQWLQNLGDTIRNVDLLSVMKAFLVIGVYLLNLLLIWAIDMLSRDQLGLLVIALEVGILFFFSISPSDSDLRLDDDTQVQSELLSSVTGRQRAIAVTNPDINRSIVFILYGVLLLVAYRIFLT